MDLTSTIKIINSPTDWEKVISEFKNLDIYYSYEYGITFANEQDGELFAAFYDNGDSKLFYPFIKRKVALADEEVNDIVTPYGYGGPYLEGPNKNLVKEFYNQFKYYCLSNNIITETIRFHPIYDNIKYCHKSMNYKYVRKTTAVDLSQPLEVIKNNYSSMNKRNIKKAKKERLICFKAENTDENIQTFIDIYYETMDRTNADSFYYFDEKLFKRQFKKSTIGETRLLFAKYNNEIISAVLLINGNRYSHYHLGASKTQFLNFKPNNLLFDFMIEYCKQNGSSILHLGGGYKENDGLFKFKSSFTNNNNFDYYIGTKIYDHKKYNKIVNEIKNIYETDKSFFPIYRGELIKKV